MLYLCSCMCVYAHRCCLTRRRASLFLFMILIRTYVLCFIFSSSCVCVFFFIYMMFFHFRAGVSLLYVTISYHLKTYFIDKTYFFVWSSLDNPSLSVHSSPFFMQRLGALQFRCVSIFFINVHPGGLITLLLYQQCSGFCFVLLYATLHYYYALSMYACTCSAE